MDLSQLRVDIREDQRKLEKWFSLVIVRPHTKDRLLTAIAERQAELLEIESILLSYKERLIDAKELVESL